MRMLKSVQFWVGLVLVALAFGGVLLFGKMTQPPAYDVAIAVKDIPAFTEVEKAYQQGYITVDTQSFSPSLLPAVVTARELEVVLADGVFVETVRAGDVLNRGRIVTGENADKVRRLSLALTEPHLVVKTIPVEAESTPHVAIGDVVDLYTTLGTVRATQVVTAGVPPLPPDVKILVEEEGPAPEEGAPEVEGAYDTEALEERRPVTITMDLPVTKRLVPGALVARVNREQIANPQYGAVTGDGQQPPPFIEGSVVSVDVVVPEETAEALDWAIFNGKMSLAVRPALWRETVENGGDLPTTPGFTWWDFNEVFWQGREELEALLSEAER